MDDKPSSKWRRFRKMRPAKRQLKRRALRIETATIKHAHKFLIRRWENARSVRRHAFTWMLLVAILIGGTGLQMIYEARDYTKALPVEGGVYAEGVLGSLDVINPLFAATSAERSASALVFSGLVGYDQNNQLRGDLASGWRSENDGKRYVVDMRKGLKWHDGKPLTADDVVFTVSRIKNQLTRSPLYSSWSSVKVAKMSDYQIAFDLARQYAPFPHALTFGILPKHLLAGVPAASLRENAFNRQPVGSGPFVFRQLQTVDADNGRFVVYLDANKNYIHGKPKLDHFQLHVFKDDEQISQAFLTDEINAATDLSSTDMRRVDAEKPGMQRPRAVIGDGMFAFFRTDSPILQDVVVRRALQLATDRPAIIRELGTGVSLESPLLDEQMTSRKTQPKPDRKAAAAMLDSSGWTLQGATRAKDGQKLKLSVVTPETGDYETVLAILAEQWRSIGAEVETHVVDPGTVQQSTIVPRAYDVFIYEMMIGADPDVYAYWHSSQADPRGLNLSNYKSEIVDETLEGAQSRSEEALRQRKYALFVDQWLADAPAVALYRPTLHYVMDESARSVSHHETLASPTTRYRNVHQWTVAQSRQFVAP